MFSFRLSGVCVCVVVSLYSGIIHAEENIPAEHFYPRDIATGTLATEHATALPHLVVSASSTLHWVDNPLSLGVPPGIRAEEPVTIRLVDSALQLDSSIAVGLWDIATLSASLPVIIYQRGEPVPELGLEGQTESETTNGFGEPRLGIKITALEWGLLGVAVEGRVFFPSSARYRSDTVRFVPNLIVGLGNEVFRVSGNVGWEFREALKTETFEGGDRFTWALGGDVAVISGLRAGLGAFGTADTERNIGSTQAVELQGGLSYEILPGLNVNVGAGTGLSKGVGSPALRVMSGIAYAPPRQDADKDGVVRALDRCPDGAEDFDGFQDEDGCPEPDNDNDGLLDADDQCPNLPEDFDGFEDEDGCPDPDNDQDGIADADDACPMVFGVIELKGCPEEDKDGDGIPDHRDQCPDVPEDFDGFNDEDGCPDPDNDQDGIPDLQDQCPNEPETLNGFEDEDGCPDEGRSNVRLRGSRLEIGERVYFDTASDRIQERSYPILRQMAAVLKSQPDLTKIRVSGHTDARGDDAMNQDLSERRAASVMRFLVENGIEAERLTSRGFGESHPVDTNDSAKGREMNRRVEFHILEKAEK